MDLFSGGDEAFLDLAVTVLHSLVEVFFRGSVRLMGCLGSRFLDRFLLITFRLKEVLH